MSQIVAPPAAEIATGQPGGLRPPADPDAAEPKRLTVQRIWGDILATLNLERGFVYTAKEMLLRPVHVVQTYLYDDRKEFTPPARFVIVLTAFATIAALYANMFDAKSMAEMQGFGDNGKFVAAMEDMLGFYQQYFQAFMLLIVPISAAFTFLLVRHGLNFAEHLVLNAYLTGVQMVIFICTVPLMWLHSVTGIVLSTLASYVYVIWAMMRLFDLKGWSGFWLITAVQVLAIVVFQFFLGGGAFCYGVYMAVTGQF